MRILVASTAGEGHFAPLVPFARSARAAGHDVRVAAPASFGEQVRAAGLVHAPFPDADPAQMGAVFASLAGKPMLQAQPVVVSEVFGRLAAGAALPGLRETVAAWRPDVVLREPAELASFVVADELGLPHVQVNIGLDALGDRLLPLLEQRVREMGADGLTGLQRAPRWTLLPESFDVPGHTGVPPQRFRALHEGDGGVRPLPDWWPGRTGPLVYVSYGSVAASTGLFPSIYTATLDALAELPARVLMTVGRAASLAALGVVPGNVHVEQWWPQRDVMPHADVVVGHGGFGTTLAALVAGVPQVVVPLFTFDQFENAARVAAVGVGATFGGHDAASRSVGALFDDASAAVEGLQATVQQVLDDLDARRTAQAVAAEIAALPTTAEALPLLSQRAPAG